MKKGIFNKSIKLLSLLVFGFLLLQYQNCGSASSKGSLTLGSTNATQLPAGSLLSATILNSPTAGVNINTFLTTPLTLSFEAGKSGTPPYNIQWLVYGSNGSLVTTGIDISQCQVNSINCNLKFSTNDTFNVRANVIDSKGLVSQAITNIIVGAQGNPPSGAACTTSMGNLDLVSVDASCNLTASGWAWHNLNLQNTIVKVEVTNLGLNSQATTVSFVRDDVNATYSCVPKAPAGKPGFIIQIPAVYSDFSVVQVKATILESNGITTHKELNTISVNLYQLNPNCVIIPNQCLPNKPCLDIQ